MSEGTTSMKALLDLFAKLRSIGTLIGLDVHQPCPALVAIAETVSEAHPGSWHPNRDGTGWVTIAIGSTSVTIYGVRRPEDWTETHVLARWDAQRRAGDFVLARAEAECRIEALAQVESFRRQVSARAG